MRVWSLVREDPLEEEMATHTGILTWEIPCTEESGGLQSTGLQKSQTRLRLNNPDNIDEDSMEMYFSPSLN